ncbi:alpha/beta fold hydrolase [Nocardia sp. CA-107356]|uniref:alpha/beta fold hydrolase n=1 Tax=Nocardia sp. CA-107356 TaxID=3239972 RepID=UPI003D918E54
MMERRMIGELVQVPAGAVHVRQDGPADGKPIVLLHGFEGSVHWWDGLTPLLADTYRVIRVDLLGFGCTTGEPGFDQRAQSEMLTAVLEQFEVTDATAVGHSWGADSALGLAELSGRVSEVVVVDQAPDCDEIRILRVMRPVLRLLGWAPIGRAVHALLNNDVLLRRALGAGFARGFDPDANGPGWSQLRSDHRAMCWRANRAVMVERPLALTVRPLDAQICALGLPALVIHGRHDSLYAWRNTTERYAAAGARVEVIDTAGHSPNVEAPDQVAAAIRDFLANPSRTRSAAS